ncbi:Mbov_0396 family ICE element transmembrane protein [Mycoplasmopsis adleri]|uniref:Mbov_0396 family ICE element transmembrane protein n=1 Tax=Mycoplasmopsis adleri TaxID=51362 RepID=UPI00387314F4
MKLIQAIINPIINAVSAPIRLAIFAPLATIGLIGFTLFSLIFILFKLFSLNLNNYLMFNLVPGQSYSQFATARPWYQFLIISFILWLINFFFFIFRYAKETNGAKAKEIYVSALKATVGGILTLILFQVIILFINILFIEITKAIFNGATNSSLGFDNIANNIIRNMIPSKGFNPKHYTDPFIGGIFPNLYWVYTFPLWWDIHANIVGYAFSTGISIALVGILISIPLIFVMFDIVSRVFINWLLFISFPFIPAFGINDGGKKMRIWKEKYFGNLLACSVYGLGLMMLGAFIGLSNTFINSQINNILGSFSIVASGYQAIFTLISIVILVLGSCFAFKKLSEIAIAFIGSEVSGGQSAKAGMSIAKMWAKAAKAKATGGASLITSALK